MQRNIRTGLKFIEIKFSIMDNLQLSMEVQDTVC